MIANLTKWLQFYKKNEFYFTAVVVVVTWWCLCLAGEALMSIQLVVDYNSSSSSTT